MKALKIFIEKLLNRLVAGFYLYPKITLLFVLLVSVLVSVQIARLNVDTSSVGLMHSRDPELIDYNQFRDQFGREELIIVSIETDEIFSFDFLNNLKSLHKEIAENTPYIEDVKSIINARNTYTNKGVLHAEELFHKWPANDAELMAIKARALENELYYNIYFSEDLDYATILVETQVYSSVAGDGDVDFSVFAEHDEIGFEQPLQRAESDPEYITDKETNEAVAAIKAIVEKYDAPDFKIEVGGYPVVNYYLRTTLVRDVGIFTSATIFTIFLLLFIVFKRPSGVFFPLLIVIFSLLSTLGLMGLMGVSFQLPTQVLPSLVIAIGVANSVHILRIFYMRLKETEDKKDALLFAFDHSGLAVFLASLTTSIALFTFITAEVGPVADMGIYASLGVMLAFVYTLILLPALISALPIREKPKTRTAQSGSDSLFYRSLAMIGRATTGHPYIILTIFVAIVAFSIISVMNIRFSYWPLIYFNVEHPIRASTETIDQNLGGSINLEVIIDTGEPNGLYDPDLLKRLNDSAEYIQTLQSGDLYVGKAWSIANVVKEINMALNDNDPAYYKVPETRNHVAQQLLLFENTGSDDLEMFTDGTFSMSRLSLRVPFTEASYCLEFVDKISEHFVNNYPDAEITITGLRVILNKTFTNAVVTMSRSYILAFLFVTILMVFFLGNFWIGILSMIPNLAPVIIVLGFMAFLQIELDLFTMLVGSLILGMVVDDTIHFLNAFIKYNEKERDVKKAIMQSYRTSGSAILITTLALSVGFGVFMLSEMNNLSDFGLVVTSAVILALSADFFVVPALLMVFSKLFAVRNGSVEGEPKPR